MGRFTSKNLCLLLLGVRDITNLESQFVFLQLCADLRLRVLIAGLIQVFSSKLSYFSDPS